MPAPPSNPINATGLLTNGEDLETLKQRLPHVDLRTGLTHRTVTRDPISGLGMASSRAPDEDDRSRPQSAGRRAYNPNLIAWNVDSSVTHNQPVRPRSTRTPLRDPIALTGDLGEEVDTLRTTSRPRSGTSREPQRNPIAGSGNFGVKEWDPIWKYNGRIRRCKSSNGTRSNPVTGQHVKTFDISLEEKPGDLRRNSRQYRSVRNVLTGENCATYTLSPGMRSPNRVLQKVTSRNAITGENCATFEVNAEMRTPRKRQPSKSSNPLNGENVNAYMVSQEEKPRPNKPYVYKNTLTGENLCTYRITPIERSITPRALTERQNPLSGENVKTYTYRIGEGNLAVKKRDHSSPLTGGCSSGQTYVISTEERIRADNGDHGSGVRSCLKSSGILRNVLTGENCSTYSVCQEMRSERSTLNAFTNGHPKNKAGYNILTGS